MLYEEQADPSDTSHGNECTATYRINGIKFKQGTKMANKLLETGNYFLIKHAETGARDAVWSNNADGSGMNSTGMQLMLIRDQLRNSDPNNELEDPWTKFLVNVYQVSLQTGECRSLEGREKWAEAIKAAAEAIVEKIQGSPVFTATICKVAEC